MNFFIQYTDIFPYLFPLPFLHSCWTLLQAQVRTSKPPSSWQNTVLLVFFLLLMSENVFLFLLWSFIFYREKNTTFSIKFLFRSCFLSTPPPAPAPAPACYLCFLTLISGLRCRGGKNKLHFTSLEKAVTSLVNAVMLLGGRGKGAGGLKVGGRKLLWTDLYSVQCRRLKWKPLKD